MIVEFLLDQIVLILGAAFDLLPTSTIGHLLPTGSSYLISMGQTIGHWNALMPVVWLLELTKNAVTVLFPVIVIYKVLNWIYKHIPQIGGFGPGSG